MQDAVVNRTSMTLPRCELYELQHQVRGAQWCNSGMAVVGVTNHSQRGFDVHSMGGNSSPIL